MQLIKIAHTLLVEKTIHVYTTYSTLEWVFKSKSLYCRAVGFAVLLSPYHLKVKRVSERDGDCLQLLQASITPTVGLDESLAIIDPCSSHETVVRLGLAFVCTSLVRIHWVRHAFRRFIEDGKTWRLWKLFVDIVEAS